MHPIRIGAIAAIKFVNGISAIPDAPRATSVRNGPSLILRMACAPISISSPNWLARDINNPPFELVTAEINASEDKPRIPASPKNAPTAHPIDAPARNFAAKSTKPRLSTCGACFTRIWLPTQTKKIPIAVFAPVLEKVAVVKPPICSRPGATVLKRTPSSSGITIVPPGTFCTVFKIFIVKPPRIAAS